MSPPEIGLFVAPDDGVADSTPVRLATRRLRDVVTARGRVRDVSRPDGAAGEGPVLLVAGAGNRFARRLFESAGIDTPVSPEAAAVVPIGRGPRPELLLSGSDSRGLAYAVHEIADRLEHSSDPEKALKFDTPVLDAPANRVRSITRLFCSEVEDKVWFYDEAFWDAYLSMLVAQRFNRFSLTLGLGYNYPAGVTDAYLYFAYPFLVDVPGYDVRVPQLPDTERERNLRTLRLVSDRAHDHGLDFQLGLWTHAYRWFDSPAADHTVAGLDDDNHGPYCRDAIREVLEACPAIDGVTLRIHGESGVRERNWQFWEMVFAGISSCGRTVGIDLHAKGLDERILGDALSTGSPVTVSPKYWAEHLGLPYHQAAIRESERPSRPDPSHLSEWHSHMAVSEGSRPFTRYGYGDFLREDRPYDLVFRIWAGTQRLLLWGDPAFAAGYGRAGGIAGSDGLEVMEPLTFKGREGSGIEAPRTGYADPELAPEYDWQKYEYTYRLLGRLFYDPDAAPHTWRRFLETRLGTAAAEAEEALASASRILPLVTVAHHQSASNNYFWPEVYTSMPLVECLGVGLDDFLIDTPAPKRFGTVSPLDPEVFMSTTEYVDELYRGMESGRAGPLRVADWLDGLSRRAAEGLAAGTRGDRSAEMRRWMIDISIQAHLGRFFAAKLRAATFYEIHLRSGEGGPLRAALAQYEVARAAWAEAVDVADGVYAQDLTFGPQAWIRGHWSDRLAAIDHDLRAIGERLDAVGSESDEAWDPPIAHGGDGPSVDHAPPNHLRPGEDLVLTASVSGGGVAGVAVRFRPMNQALVWREREMDGGERQFAVTIPAADIDPSYPLAYAFVVRGTGGRAWRRPDLGSSLSEVPYYVVRRVDRSR